MKPQCKMVLDYLEQHGSITSLEAFRDLGISRLASRIFDLESLEGYDFDRVKERGKNRFGKTVVYTRYSMADDRSDAYDLW